MFKFKQTKAQAQRSKKLANVVSKGRSFIKGKRKEETRILATLEVARDIISDKNFWVQGTWFDAGVSGYSKSLVEGEDIDSYEMLKSVEQEYECSLEDKVCKVCAEGAIYLAADTIIDGSIAINAINGALNDLNHQAYLEREKQEVEKAKSKGDPDNYHWYNWEYDFEYPYLEGSIQEINDSGDRSKAHKNTLKAFDDGIAHLKKHYKVK